MLELIAKLETAKQECICGKCRTGLDKAIEVIRNHQPDELPGRVGDEAIRKCNYALNFFKSVILAGERWSTVCQAAFDDAKAALQQQPPQVVAGGEFQAMDSAPRDGAFLSWCRWHMIPNTKMCEPSAKPYWTLWAWRHTWMYDNKPQGDGSPLYLVSKVEATHWTHFPPSPTPPAENPRHD